ncbi:adhesion G protein-coupled receptor E5 [Salvelinus sp. IW2-2015]|uniref:adhesion G protein-coupled receptor E5 n=1 Tax=Salvelinus sp. IW2-2015 TaxID=2691554 RepID=UPI0038D509D7
MLSIDFFHCWLSLERGFIWSFFGPVCTIIILNVFFFIITVWRLAQKFSSLNPDLSNLRKIKVFTVTAVAQLCVLGTMWIFGVFQFQEEGTVVMTYLFTILNSLQGALLFIMHCLLNKTVREEYCKLLSCICTPQKKEILRGQHYQPFLQPIPGVKERREHGGVADMTSPNPHNAPLYSPSHDKCSH